MFGIFYITKLYTYIRIQNLGIFDISKICTDIRIKICIENFIFILN